MIKEGLVFNIYKQALNDILSEKAGLSGNPYYTVRDFSAIYNISTVTANKVINMLKKNYFIRALAKTNYISYTQFVSGTQLHAKYSSSKLIGLHLNYIENTFFSKLARKLEDYASSIGYKLLICLSNRSIEKELEIMNRFFELGVKGVINFPNESVNLVNFYQNYPLPFVFIANTVKGVNTSSAVVDNKTASHMVGQHLVDKGYKSFCYILPNHVDKHNIRLVGYREILLQNNFCLQDSDILSVPNIYELKRILLPYIKMVNLPLGIYCHHDLLGIEAIRVCSILGFDIPNQIGIVGFDNLPEATHIDPPLTTVDYNMNFFIKETFNLLQKEVNMLSTSHELKYIQPILLVRSSSSRIP